MNHILAISFVLFFAAGCHATPGPDKSVAGAVLGAGWGAGAGAVIGNQVGNVGPGAGIGAGIGAVSGLATGIGLDIAEGTELRERRKLDAVKIQTAANYRTLVAMQDTLDSKAFSNEAGSGFLDQIYFDENRASLRLGSAAKLEQLADSLKQNPSVGVIELHGHSDDVGSAVKNERLAEARARTVATFLSNQGISVHQLKIISHAAKRPVTSNENQAGRQLNRRVEIVVVR